MKLKEATDEKRSAKEVLLFAGTTEGRVLSEYLADAGIAHTVCVATEYGRIVLKPHACAKVHQGRMGRAEMESFLEKGHFAAVVDATHPYAKEVTACIKGAVEEIGKKGVHIPCLRLERERTIREDTAWEGQRIRYFQTDEACAKALEGSSGNILLTIGSKALSVYCACEQLRNRLYVRVLPSVESLMLCKEQGIPENRILAMQGPFSAQMNEAVIRQYGISCLVTKESGPAGGYPEKMEAAERTDIQVSVIGRPEESGGDSMAVVCSRLEEICGKKIRLTPGSSHMEVVLAGIGMGSKNCWTKEAEEAINSADILFGAKRLLEHICVKAEKYPYYQAAQIIPCLWDIQRRQQPGEDKKAVVLFSGDSGCYSGCQSLYEALEIEVREERLKASLRILPGISSVAYFAARIKESYQDAAVRSIHGKKRDDLIHTIRYNEKTFLLTSGARDVNWLGNMLLEAGLTQCRVTTGYQLSCAEEKIQQLTPLACCALKEEGLYTCFIENPSAEKRKLTHGMGDGEFIRDKVPMTKEEVREVSICKLRLQEGAVVYDIGSGTGSIAVETAALSETIQVYAIEYRQEAVSLIRRNKDKWGLRNITVVEQKAPEGFFGLPPAHCAFIGGSGGRLKEILAVLKQINPAMRVVINAVSMETISELREVLDLDGIREEEIIQMQVNRVKAAGNYHLARSENPVWICAFQFGA